MSGLSPVRGTSLEAMVATLGRACSVPLTNYFLLPTCTRTATPSERLSGQFLSGCLKATGKQTAAINSLPQPG